MTRVSAENGKIIIYKKKSNKKVSYKSVNIYPETFEILSNLRKKTGWGMAILIQGFVDYCMDKVEIREG